MCGCRSAATLQSIFAGNPGILDVILNNVREPFKSAIKSHFQSMAFDCRTNKEYADCQKENAFGWSSTGVFRDITYEFYSPLVVSGNVMGGYLPIDLKKQWNTQATLCSDQLGENIMTWFKTAIHETAHNIGWGNHYIDDKDSSFNNQHLPPKQKIDPHHKQAEWGIPTGNL